MVSEKQANRRIRLLFVVFALLFGATLARAGWLQVVKAAQFSRMAVRQHEHTVTVPAWRGTIYDTDGADLALGVQTTTVFADPTELRQPRAVAIAAGKLLGADPNTLYPELLNKKTRFVYVDRFGDPAQAAKFLKKGFAGVGSYPEEKRNYPQGSVGAQVVGFAGTDDKGLGGLELAYNTQLSGSPGVQTQVDDPFGRPIDIVKSRAVREGADLHTTLDHTIQAQAEQVLRQTVTEWHAKDASAIVLDPRTGAVLAMAQAPGYNANETNKVSLPLQRNRSVTDTFEPGSTFKLVTISAAISSGIVSPSTRFRLPYSIRVADRVIHDAEPRPTEWMTVSQILARSSNVGAITIARLLGPARLGAWIQRFGFGKLTGIDFPGESQGIVLPVDRWSGSTIGTVPIGQGIAVTPIQLATAYGAIANGGVWVQPHLVKRVGGHVEKGFVHRRLVLPAIDAELKTMLTGVVDEHGATGNAAAIPGYSVAGKTGTAQKPGPNGYIPGAYVASFVGMVPVKHPRLLVLVVVDEPHRAIFGGTVAAPAFAEIAKFDLQYLSVAPDEPQNLQ
jgi:cell division protein FtsI (penicillin-binding protein 3)/stage V sporulation protein D (sporulation-specific penicillin-binding protein)